jgi:TPR repeat protein
MFLLSRECDDPAERRRWLRMAAEEGHVQAMHEMGLACSDPNEKRRWLEEAARNGWQAAMLELAEMGF